MNAATLSLSPAAGSFETGQQVSIKILATSNDTPFNAVSGVVSFPTSIFSIESVSKTNSVLDFWVTEPAISKSAGTVTFEGIALGGSGKSSGTVITINLRAIKAGTGKASFLSGHILASDGQGTEITGNLIGANYSVKEATLKPKPTEKNPLPTQTPEPPQPLPTLHAPEIMLGSRYGAQAIVGKSDYGKAEVLVTFVSESGAKIFILGNSDEDGGFTLVVPSSLKHGLYKVTAVMIREDKTSSEPSNTITVEVGSIISDISWQLSFLIMLLILSVIYLILRTHIHFGRVQTSTRLQRNKKL